MEKGYRSTPSTALFSLYIRSTLDERAIGMRSRSESVRTRKALYLPTPNFPVPVKDATNP